MLHDQSQPKILEKLINNKLYSPTILLPKMKEKWFLYHNKSPIKSHIHLNESVIFNNSKRQRFSLRQGKTDNKNGKLVLQYCSKTSWVATLRVFNTNHEQPRIKPTSFPGSLSYPYGRVGENPGNEVGIKPVSPTNRVVTDCEKLLQTVESSSIFFYNKISNVARFTGPRQTCFAAGYVNTVYGVTSV